MTSTMFTNKLKENFSVNEPIFTGELLKLFSNKSRAQVFRYVESAKENEELVQDSTGVYYMPTMTILGTQSKLSPEEIVRKKYIKNDKDVYGVYSGIELLNMFGMTTQMAATITIVTNNESSKKRIIKIRNRQFIVKKSRCKITKDNFAYYTLFELFNCMYNDEKINADAKRRILDFMKKNKMEFMKICDMAKCFPSKAVKKLMNSGVIYDFVR